LPLAVGPQRVVTKGRTMPGFKTGRGLLRTVAVVPGAMLALLPRVT
jgi:hypothetical protein